MPFVGDEAAPYTDLLILPDKKECLPATTEYFMALAISNGFLALAIAVLTNTPSQPNSSAIVASEA